MLNLKHRACFRCLYDAGPFRPFAKDEGFVLNFRGPFLRMVIYRMSSTSLPGRRAALPLLLCVSLCLPGMTAPVGAKKDARKPPPQMSAAIERPTITVGDPKMPGRILAVVKASFAQGDFAGQGFLGNMTQVHALLYQQGGQAATLDAPRANGSQNSATKNVIVVGTGGVVIRSLTEPGTSLTADRVVWYASINKIVATGHAVYHNAKTAITFRSPTIIADTKLKSVKTGPGQMAGVF